MRTFWRDLQSELPDAWNSALTSAGVLAGLVVAWCAFLGLAVLTRPLGVLLLALSHGGH